MDPRLRQAIAMLAEDVSRPLDLEAISRSLNLSPSRLRHLFKDETGLPPAQYLKRLRIERARELFESTFLSLKEVMLRVGLSDESHFVRDFKKAHGMPPVRYRRLRGGSFQLFPSGVAIRAKK
jgi:AraC-like DNA-binding protein